MDRRVDDQGTFGDGFFHLVLEITMKMSKKLFTNSVAAVVAAMGMGVAGSANALEVAASAAVANMYLWRGQDLGNGDPAVSGDIKVTESGFHTGLWGSSGDATYGTEYDVWAGYGGAAGDFRYDLTFWNYIYPSDTTLDDDNDGFADLSEAVLTLGFGPVTFMYYDNIAGAPNYYYYTLGATFGAFSGLIGYSINEDAVVSEFDGSTDDSDYTHIDVSYAYNENLAFTLSQVIDEGPDNDQVDDDLKFVVKYSLPIK